MYESVVYRVASRFLYGGPLRDVSKLRYQAVFLIGAGGSGKGFVGMKWMKYMPGAPSEGSSSPELLKRKLTEQERGFSNLNFEKAVAELGRKGIRIEMLDASTAKIPFRIFQFNEDGSATQIQPQDWDSLLPPDVSKQIHGLTEVVFSTPVYELPSYWRQVNPDIYKEELAGYVEQTPGYVHTMSLDMSKAYFEAAVETGDPLFVDGTGSDLSRTGDQMASAKKHGYRISLVYVLVPLVVNQIRNALRPRKVDPGIIAGQWHKIQKNFHSLRTMADKSKVVINRNDTADIGQYKRNKEEVDLFVREKTNGRCQDLYDLIAEQNPSEINEWGDYLR